MATPDQFDKLIMAVEALNDVWSSSILPFSAIFVAVVSLGFTIYWSTKQRKESHIKHLLGIWDEVISGFASHPRFLNKKITNSYPYFDDPNDRFAYDSYCFKAWGLFRQIVEGNYEKQNSEFLQISQWIVALHYTWLENNPVYFSDSKFWERVEELKRQPIGILNAVPLPRTETKSSQDGRYTSAIDWCKIAPNYHSFILGPFAPEMVQKDSNGKSRNALVNALNEYTPEQLSELCILDIGCGPGNLLKVLPAPPRIVTGVDLSQSALDYAEKVAKEKNINFKPVLADIRSLTFENEFDIIISVNSILPNSREEVHKILRGVRKALKSEGVFYAILPSFDTTVYLRELWHDYYIKTYKSREYAERCVKQLDRYKLVDNESLLYADDGAHRQAYHTKDSIIDEFGEAGLSISCDPTKVYYPWELTRRFDYGYFPDAEEETWDWFVVATKNSKK